MSSHRSQPPPGQDCLFWAMGACPCPTEAREGCHWHPSSAIAGGERPVGPEEFDEAELVAEPAAGRTLVTAETIGEFDEACSVTADDLAMLCYVVVEISDEE